MVNKCDYSCTVCNDKCAFTMNHKSSCSCLKLGCISGTPSVVDITSDQDKERRVTDPNTGGEKGKKLPQLSCLDPRGLLELARVAGYGCIKYARLNYTKGFDWSLSYDAAQRHLNAFWDGEQLVTDDKEAEPYKLHHLACAAWHCLTLLMFSMRGIGTDDRYKGKK